MRALRRRKFAVAPAAPRDDSPSSLFSPESWTEKGFDGVQRLPAACRAAEATTAEAEHLALAFLSQDADSVVARTLSKAGSSAASLKRQLEDFSARQPKVKGAAPEQPWPAVRPMRAWPSISGGSDHIDKSLWLNSLQTTSTTT